MASVHIRALIGKGGETIREVRAKATGDIKIEHQHTDPQGVLTITGDVEKSINLIKDTLESKGCPWSGPEPLGTGPLAAGNCKSFKMDAVHIRALIGKGGETIREVRAKSTADIKIEHQQDQPQGTVTINGDVDKAEALIRETLQTKGHAWTGPEEEVIPIMPGAIAPAGAALMQIPAIPAIEMNDVFVPPELMPQIMGPGGATLKDVRAKTGNSVLISILPPAAPGGPQTVRLVGSGREMARQMVEQMLEQLKKGGMSGRPPLPGGPLGGMLALGAPPPPPPPPLLHVQPTTAPAENTHGAGEGTMHAAHSPQVVLPPNRPRAPLVGFLSKNRPGPIGATGPSIVRPPGAVASESFPPLWGGTQPAWAGTQPAWAGAQPAFPPAGEPMSMSETNGGWADPTSGTSSAQTSMPSGHFTNQDFGGAGFTQPGQATPFHRPPGPPLAEFPRFPNGMLSAPSAKPNIDQTEL